ncbi:hypothetical protein BKI52_07240 [marine bacterium AO1-C]|nr:hypothetical protein BKI52_07240 [marine bacterium AO1-C]
MKIICLSLLLLILCTPLAQAQNDIGAISQTLMHYIEGTTNGQPERLRKAFHPDFQLFLAAADTLRTIDGQGYISRVKKGQKYNRKSRIVSIDYENDAAMAKIEVYFPDTKRIATDYLMLLKLNDDWKIITKFINVKNYKSIQDLQTKEKQGIAEVKETLQHYIEATANGQPGRLMQAFHPDLNLYYVKNKQLAIIPGKRYIKNFEVGKKYARIGNVLAIDYENDAAVGKIQILMPNRNRIAIDYLFLLKINGTWKIIHKSFTSKVY